MKVSCALFSSLLATLGYMYANVSMSVAWAHAEGPRAMPIALPTGSYGNDIALCAGKLGAMNGTWQVSFDQAERIDSMLMQELSSRPYRRKLSGKPTDYVRQYMGFYRGDRAIVLVNAVAPPPPTSRTAVAIDCAVGRFFTIEYDLSFEKFGGFAVAAKPNRGSRGR